LQQNASHSITSSAHASSEGEDGEAERIGGLDVYSQLALDALLDRKVSRLFGSENLSGIDPYLLICMSHVGP
jgi:hypothetical protein